MPRGTFFGLPVSKFRSYFSIMRTLALGLIALLAVLITSAGTTAKLPPPILFCQESLEPYNDWNDYIGPVESIRVEYAEPSFSEKPLLRQISRFNRRGQKIENVSYRDDGVALPRSTYSYDSKGRLVKAHHYQVNGSISLENTYTYGLDGRLRGDIQRSLEHNRILSRKSYTHDGKRNFTKVSDFDWRGKLRYRIGFLRDTQCRITDAYGYNPDGSINGKIVFSYDKRNNVVESVLYSSSGSIRQRQKADYDFDDRGNWVKQVRSKWVVEGGNGFYKPEYVTYRKFTYN